MSERYNDMDKLNLISERFSELGIQTALYPSDEANPAAALILRFKDLFGLYRNYDCIYIHGLTPRTEERDLMIYTTVIDHISPKNPETILSTINKLNQIQPFGHFGMNTGEQQIYWKYTVPTHEYDDLSGAFASDIARRLECASVSINESLQLIKTAIESPQDVDTAWNSYKWKGLL
jgi:hypothetical protein